MIRRELVPDFKRISATRVVVTPKAIESADWQKNDIVLPLAKDEVLVLGKVDLNDINDPHALVVPDSEFVGTWVASNEAMKLLERTCSWKLPINRPAFAQGAIAEIPVKLWFEKDRVLILTPGPYAIDLEERLS